MISFNIIKVFPGYGFGIRQPTFLLEATIQVDSNLKFEQFNRIIANLLGEPSDDNKSKVWKIESIIERLVNLLITLQSRQKIPVFDKAKILNIRNLDSTNQQRIIIATPYNNIAASRLTLSWLLEVINTIATVNNPKEIEDKLKLALQTIEKKLMSYGIANTNTIHFLRAAFKQGITTWPLWATCYGFGIASRMRRLDSSLTDQTSSMAVRIAQNKALTASILRKHGISTPQHKVVENLEQAIEYANEIGYPIVVKPDNQEQGRGVSAGIRNSSSLEAAFKNSQTFSKNIIIEKHYFGQEYRLTVFNDEVLKVIQRLPCSVIGDGIHTIDELVSIEQTKERYKRVERQTGKLLIQLDEEALDLLCERGYNINTIPSIGDVVVLRRKSNISAGGSQSHVSIDSIHPDNLNLAVRASQAVGLDLCGVDLIMPDISQSWIEVGAMIIELNSIPQIGIDIAPETYEQILALIGQNKWTIPVQLLVCESNATIPSYANIINVCGPADGISTGNGVWISGKLISKNPNNGFDACTHLLMNTTVKKAVCCLTVDEIVKFGLPIPWFNSIILDQNFTTDKNSVSKWGLCKDILTSHSPKILGTSAKS